MSTTYDIPAIHGPCTCVASLGSDETEVLRRLVASGMSQWEASMRPWGPAANVIDRDVREWVRIRLMTLCPWLDLTKLGAA